jgi:hypothetical protein
MPPKASAHAISTTLAAANKALGKAISKDLYDQLTDEHISAEDLAATEARMEELKAALTAATGGIRRAEAARDEAAGAHAQALIRWLSESGKGRPDAASKAAAEQTRAAWSAAVGSVQAAYRRHAEATDALLLGAQLENAVTDQEKGQRLPPARGGAVGSFFRWLRVGG